MKQFLYIMPILLCASSISAKNFGSGFAWGSFAGFTSGMIASEMRRYQQPCKPSLYVYPEPRVYVVPQPVQPQVVYYPQSQQIPHTNETLIVKNTSECKDCKNALECEECKVDSQKLQLEILKEQNRKKKLALKEKKLDSQILKLKQV